MQKPPPRVTIPARNGTINHSVLVRHREMHGDAALQVGATARRDRNAGLLCAPPWVSHVQHTPPAVLTHTQTEISGDEQLSIAHSP